MMPSDVLFTNDAERAVKILKKNYGNSETILEQLLNEVKSSKELEVIPRIFKYGGELVSNCGKFR
jgi:hypothetical protein